MAAIVHISPCPGGESPFSQIAFMAAFQGFLVQHDTKAGAFGHLDEPILHLKRPTLDDIIGIPVKQGLAGLPDMFECSG